MLDAVARLGELLAHRPNRGSHPRTPDGKVHGEAPLPPTVSKKDSHYAQDMADILLDAEVRLGEILEAIPQAPPIGFSSGNRISLPTDISKKQSHQAQTLSKHPEIVEQAKAEAHEAALSDAQDMADILLDAEIKLGELLSPLADPTAFRAGRRQLPECITLLSARTSITEKCAST